jgi:SAM-dependent methyltransferase
MPSASTFRDPDASLTIADGKVIRAVRSASADAFAELLANPFVQDLLASGRLIGTRPLDRPREPSAVDSRRDAVYYEHDLVPFIAYPVEWSPAMLARAAEFTLTLCLDLLPHGFILKDATPANVLFTGSTPVQVDVPSIALRPTGTFIWGAQDQFERTFMLPLIANVEAGVPISWSLQDPARGLDHETVYRVLGRTSWIRPSLMQSVALPAMLTRRAADRARREPAPMRNDAVAQYAIERTLRSNLNKVRKLTASIRDRSRSMWQGYTQTRTHYADADIAAKREFVADALRAVSPGWVLDIGANTGEFSRLAAAVARVVAVDSDEAAVNRIFLESEHEHGKVLAIVGDIARPTPASGWNNAESTSFLDRAKDRFDLVLMLAVIHHLRATAGVPVARILDLARTLTRSHLLIEQVPLADPMFQRLSRGRDSLFGDAERDAFEAELERHFAFEQRRELPNGRTLYLVRKR